MSGERRFSDWLAGAPVPPGEVLAVGAAVAEEMARRHRTGVAPLWLAPERIRIGSRDRGGYVALVDDPPRKADAGLGVARLSHLAPETIAAGTADERTDAYALGALLYRALNGAEPFDGESPVELLAAKLEGRLRPPGSGVEEVRPELHRLLRDLLAVEPSARPAMEKVVLVISAAAREIAVPAPRRRTRPSPNWIEEAGRKRAAGAAEDAYRAYFQAATASRAPDRARGWLGMAETALRMRRNSEAKERARQAVAAGADAARGWSVVGEAAGRGGCE